MKKQKTYKYNKPAVEGKKAPLILCYANNEVHAMQVLRERFNGEHIDKTLIEEYVSAPKKDRTRAKGKK